MRRPGTVAEPVRSRPVRRRSTSDRRARTARRTRLRRDRQAEASGVPPQPPARAGARSGTGRLPPGPTSAAPATRYRGSSRPSRILQSGMLSNRTEAREPLSPRTSAHRSKPNSPAPRGPGAEVASRPSAIGARSARPGFVRLHPRDAPRTRQACACPTRSRPSAARRRATRRLRPAAAVTSPLRSRWQPARARQPRCEHRSVRNTAAPTPRIVPTAISPSAAPPMPATSTTTATLSARARAARDARPALRRWAAQLLHRARARPRPGIRPRQTRGRPRAVGCANIICNPLGARRRRPRTGQGGLPGPGRTCARGSGRAAALALGGRGPAGRAYGGLGWS